MSFLAELKTRRVFRATLGYGVAAFAVLQIIEPIMHGFHWPDAVLSWALVALTAGFPLVVGIAWIFEDRAPAQPARLMIIGALAILLGVTGWYFQVHRRTVSPQAIGGIPSIAVLPFADLSSGKDQGYFSDGLAEEILDVLAQTQELRVAGRTSSFAFRGHEEDLRTIGQKLNVTHVLEGSVRRENARVRITAQLIDAGVGYHLWSHSYERELTGVFAVQEEIAHAVAEALRLKLLPNVARERRTNVPEAYDEYLKGKLAYFSGSAGDLRKAVTSFQRSVELDPRFAPALAWLAHARFNLSQETDDFALALQMRDEAEAAATQAIVLAPDSVDALAANGRIRAQYRQDWEGGLRDLERASRLNPSDATVLRVFAAILYPLGRFEESIAQARKAVEIDPAAANSWTVLGAALLNSGRNSEARKAYTQALELSHNHALTLSALPELDLMEGKPADALRRVNGRPEIHRLYYGALAQWDPGNRGEADKALDELMRKYAKRVPFYIARVFARRGDTEQAFKWLDRAIEARDILTGLLKTDPLLRNLRTDPRFPILLRRLNLPAN